MNTTTPPIVDETDLVRRLKAGGEAACETLVRDYGPRMLAVASRYFQSESDRDDAVQDAFISAWKAIQSFDGKSKLATWLHRITVNACLMKLRSRKQKRETSIDEMLPTFDHAGHHTHGVAEWKTEAADSPLSGTLTAELREQVRGCINRLPESYRIVLMMRDIEGLDTQETAAALGCSIVSVKTRLHRARLALRELLTPLFAEQTA